MIHSVALTTEKLINARTPNTCCTEGCMFMGCFYTCLAFLSFDSQIMKNLTDKYYFMVPNFPSFAMKTQMHMNSETQVHKRLVQYSTGDYNTVRSDASLNFEHCKTIFS